MAFRFEKPVSFKFTCGQFIDITLLNPPVDDDNIRIEEFAGY